MQTHMQRVLSTATNQKQEKEEDKSQVTVQHKLTGY